MVWWRIVVPLPYSIGPYHPHTQPLSIARIIVILFVPEIVSIIGTIEISLVAEVSNFLMRLAYLVRDAVRVLSSSAIHVAFVFYLRG